MVENELSAQEKALKINLDAVRFGTFAEIGAGQEVARWFFHVGKSSSTVAKSISAYDMAISDGLYGATQRYVSRARLEAMLDREFSQLLEQRMAGEGKKTRSSSSPIHWPLTAHPVRPGGSEFGSRINPDRSRLKSSFTLKCWTPSARASRRPSV